MENDTWDFLILGSGLTECIISGILSTENKKVLHIDRNNYYGGECATFSFQKLKEKAKVFKFGSNNDLINVKKEIFNIDLVPKFIIKSGKLAKILLETKVNNYLEFMPIQKLFICRNNKIFTVPTSEKEAVISPLFGFMEKYGAYKFFSFIKNYNQDDETTHNGLNLEKVTMKEVYKNFSINQQMQEFIGHALAFFPDNRYTEEMAIKAYKNIILYMRSMYGEKNTPYIYPLYGLSELPQAFARLSAVYGGTFMLSTDIEDYKRDGQLFKVKLKGYGEIKCNSIIGDPSYFPMYSKKIGEVIRAVYITDSTIPGIENVHSAQIIIPQGQVNRNSDIYISFLSNLHEACPNGKYVIYIGAMKENDDPYDDLRMAFEIIKPKSDVYYFIHDLFWPTHNVPDDIYISKSYDPTSNFESVYDDVKRICSLINRKFPINRKL